MIHVYYNHTFMMNKPFNNCEIPHAYINTVYHMKFNVRTAIPIPIGHYL